MQKQLTWQDVEKLIAEVSSKIREKSKKYDWIISINRGGLIPGVMLSHELGVSHGVITVTHESGAGYPAIDGVIKDLYISGVKLIKPHHSILLFDDIARSGICLSESVSTIRRLDSDAKNVDTGVLHLRKGSILKPTYFAEEIGESNCVVYPWEKKNARTRVSD